MQETWKNITGYEGHYQISNLGNVISLYDQHMIHGKLVKTDRVKLMIPFNNGNGYLVVSLRSNGARKNHYVHRLVASAFCSNPNNREYINHKNFDKSDNRVDNLEWCTQAQNVRHSIQNMKKEKLVYKPTNTGEKYIRMKGCRYYLYMRRHNISKSFKSLEDAIKYRNNIWRCC